MRRAIPDTADEVSQLCGHIRRTLKAEVYLAALTLLALWVMWSVAQIGRERLVSINSASADSRRAYYAGDKMLANLASDVTPDRAWEADETEVVFDKAFIAIAASDKRLLKAFQPQIARVSTIENFDIERRNAFNIDLSPPYVKQTFTINAIDLANLCPFVMMTMLTILLTLRLRQNAYEVVLAATFLDGRPHPSEQARLHALAEFRAGTLTMRESLKGRVWVYERPFAKFVELPIALAFVALILWYSARLLFLAGSALAATHSVFFNYYGYMFTAAVAGLIILRKTSSHYTSHLRSILGGPVVGLLSYNLTRISLSAEAPSPGLARAASFRGRLVAFGGIIALLCPIFPWMTRSPFAGQFHGYDFLRFYPPFSGTHPPQKSLEIIYTLDPHIFAEFKWLLVFSLVFVVFSIVASQSWLWRKDTTVHLRNIRRLLSYSLFVLAGYLICYLLGLNFLQSNSEIAQTNAILGMTFEGTHQLATGGLPLLFYNPSPAFWVFFAACVLLAAEGITGEHRRPWRLTGAGGK